MTTAAKALKNLQKGNKRFVKKEAEACADTKLLTEETTKQQRAIAAVLGCSDSRVPVEHIFSQGIGSLFVVRVAGNVAGELQVASLEFAVEQLGVNLIVVMGHTQCGAIIATIESTQDSTVGSGNLLALTEEIAPAVAQAIVEKPHAGKAELVDLAVRYNISAAEAQILSRSELIRSKVESGDLTIVGACYCIETGAVEFE